MEPPILIFDSRESYFPVGVEESLAANGVKFPAAGGRIDLPPKLQHPQRPSRPVVYHRVVHTVGVDWHQWWYWYLYNPGPPAFHGVGRHEGDWEMIQVGCIGDSPLLVTLSQHHTASKREWWASEVREGRLVVYVALGSHANYFTPGKQRDLDESDGRGKLLADFEQRDFGDWAEWRGRWGNSDNSPGPLITRRAWNVPHLIHSAAR